MNISSKKRYKIRQRIKCKIQSILNKNKPRYCVHHEYLIQRGNFLLQQKLKRTKTKNQLHKICQSHKEDYQREMKKYSLNQITKKIFESLKKDEIEEVLDDPIFFFRHNNCLLSFIKKRVRNLEKKYLKPFVLQRIRRVNTEIIKNTKREIKLSGNISCKRLINISPEIK